MFPLPSYLYDGLLEYTFPNMTYIFLQKLANITFCLLVSRAVIEKSVVNLTLIYFQVICHFLQKLSECSVSIINYTNEIISVIM